MGEGLILAALLTVTQNNKFTDNENYNDAIKYASIATMEETGTKKIADSEIKDYKRWYKREVSKEVQVVLGYSFWLAKVAQDKRIVYTWSF